MGFQVPLVNGSCVLSLLRVKVPYGNISFLCWFVSRFVLVAYKGRMNMTLFAAGMKTFAYGQYSSTCITCASSKHCRLHCNRFCLFHCLCFLQKHCPDTLYPGVALPLRSLLPCFEECGTAFLCRMSSQEQYHGLANKHAQSTVLPVNKTNAFRPRGKEKKIPHLFS